LIVNVCLFENHQPRVTMPLSSRSRGSPHEYAVRVTPEIVESATTMVVKEIERGSYFCECCIAITLVGGHNYGNAEYFLALGVAKEP
jgi:hypothetical protein